MHLWYRSKPGVTEQALTYGILIVTALLKYKGSQEET